MVDKMTTKKIYTYQFILFSLTVVALGYVIRTPILPIKKETKTTLGYSRDSLLNFTELTAQYGYVSEEHRVITEDGYILTMFRIVKAKNCHGKKKFPPVLLMHGLLLSSDCWIESGPQAGLAYLIADACYDLWVGNSRGNYYSRSHVSLNPDKDEDFWQFEVEEIGKYDAAAMIDYILDHTGAKKMNYIGFSQGTGTFLVMCSERPGYCEKVNVLIALAPSSRHLNTKSFIFRTVTEFFSKTESVLASYGVTEVLTKGGLAQEFLQFFCQLTEITGSICDEALKLFDHVDDFHHGSITNETIRNMFGHFPAGTSLHNMAHYGQYVTSARFAKFDYGKQKNIEVYGSERSPEYNLSAVSIPVVCIYGKNDGLVDTKDVKWMLSKLPNVIESVKVKDPLWNHLDMAFSQYTSELIFPKVNEYLSKYSKP